MIDFRFHLISIVAVFLALGLGILMGSGFLGDVVIRDLKKQIADIDERNRQHQADISALRADLRREGEFLLFARPALTDDSLRGEDVVLFTAGGVDENVRNEAITSITEAGGQLASTITFTDKFSLPGEPEREQLGFIVGPGADERSELLDQTGNLIGLRAGSAAEAGTQNRGSTLSILEELLTDLEDADFISIDRQEDLATVPIDATFVFVGGAEEDPPFDVARLIAAVADGITDRGSPILVAETSNSSWEVVATIRSDPELREEVSTVDQIETVAGQVATVLGLRIEAQAGPVDTAGHYGVMDGATELAPPIPAG
jgi:Copper transport outer membrane protein, MctB